MRKEIRIYEKKINEWLCEGKLRQVEIAYTDYDSETGEIIRQGTEDFSAERSRNLHRYFTYIWDGERRNKGGYRWFYEKGTIKIDTTRNKIKEIKELIKKSKELQQKLLITKEKIELVDLRIC